MSTETLAALAASPVVAFIARLTAILALGFVATTLLHRRSAAMRHLAWTLTMFSALLLAPVSALAPRFDITVPGEFAAAVLNPAASRAPAELSLETRVVSGASRAVVSGPAVPSVAQSLEAARTVGESALLIWATGALLIVGWFALGHIGLSRLARRAISIESGPWSAELAEIAARMNVRRPIRLAVSNELGTPITWRAAHPAILLPPNAEHWSADRRRVVLLHEVAHISRLDYLSQALGAVVCALYWLHPLAWLAARRMRAESERAADDRVIAAGTLPTDYATHLLNVARGAIELRLTGAVAIGMARKSTLEGRMLALLDDRRDRRSTSRLGQALAVTFGLSALVAVASIHPVSAEAQDRRAQAERAAVERRGVAELRGVNEGPEGQSVSRSVDANGATTLNIVLRSGGVLMIHGTDDKIVRVKGRTKSEKGTLDQMTLTAGRGQVELRTVAAPRGDNAVYQYEVLVPRKFNIVLESSGGEVSVMDLEGTVRGNTAEGEISIERVNGRAELSTGRGEIRVTASRLEGTVATDVGNVRFNRVEGGLKGVTSKGEFSHTNTEYREYTVKSSDGTVYTTRLDGPKELDERKIKEMESGRVRALLKKPEGEGRESAEINELRAKVARAEMELKGVAGNVEALEKLKRAEAELKGWSPERDLAEREKFGRLIVKDGQEVEKMKEVSRTIEERQKAEMLKKGDGYFEFMGEKPVAVERPVATCANGKTVTPRMIEELARKIYGEPSASAETRARTIIGLDFNAECRLSATAITAEWETVGRADDAMEKFFHASRVWPVGGITTLGRTPQGGSAGPYVVWGVRDKKD
jgi:beta-lactamase regulating signal transducer with metallopeptidase domain